MTFGHVRKPSTGYYLAYIQRRQRGGAIPMRVFRGRSHTGDGALQNIISAVGPWIRRIPEFFRSSMGQKVAKGIAKTGTTVGLNVLQDRYERKIPLKESLRARGKEGVFDLVDKAKRGISKMEGGRRRRRRRKKRTIKKGIKRRRKGGCKKRTSRRKGGVGKKGRRKKRRTLTTLDYLGA